MSLLYRVRQFWHTLSINPDQHALDQVKVQLTPAQWELFSRLQPAEMGHAIMIYRRLVSQGETQPDLLVAALLHDVGKVRYRMNPLQRTLVVLAKGIMPGQVERWGTQPAAGWDHLPGWHKAFIVAAQHADWGADMVHQLSVSALTESLIRNHHRPQATRGTDLESRLLHKLWLVDSQS